MVEPTKLPDLKLQSGNNVGKITIVFLDTQGVLSYIPISSELFPWGQLRFKVSLRIVFRDWLQEQFIAKNSPRLRKCAHKQGRCRRCTP